MRSPSELTDAFRAQGLKVTPQRQLLFRLLHGNDQHPTAETLYSVASAEMPGISLRTVYQTLSELTAMGELDQFVLGAGPARFDPNTSEHHHAVCSECGVLRDIYVGGPDGVEPADLAGAGIEVNGLDGFAATSLSLVIHGRCTSCATAAVDADGHSAGTQQDQ